MSDYPGIDYSRGSANIDLATGIRYGSILTTALDPDAAGTLWYGPHSTDPFFEELLEQHLTVERERWVRSGHTLESFDPALSGMAFVDCYDQLVAHYDDGEVKAIISDTNHVLVVGSPYYTYAQFCAPTIPGAGNLYVPFTGTEEAAQQAGFPKVYCLGDQWFASGTAPYPLYPVCTT